MSLLVLAEGVILGVHLQRSGLADKLQKDITDKYNEFIKQNQESQARADQEAVKGEIL